MLGHHLLRVSSDLEQGGSKLWGRGHPPFNDPPPSLSLPPPQRYLPPQKNKLWLSCFVILLVTTDGCRYVCRRVCRRASRNYPYINFTHEICRLFLQWRMSGQKFTWIQKKFWTQINFQPKNCFRTKNVYVLKIHSFFFIRTSKIRLKLWLFLGFRHLSIKKCS